MKNSTEQSPSWWTNGYCLASEESSCLLWNRKVYHLLQKSLPLGIILDQMDPVHIPSTSFRK
jgi:hypothetical protein